jgi:membrane protease YdiL (CAAX protease family)
MMVVLIVAFVVYVALATVSGRIMTARLRGVEITGGMRMSFYNYGILESWIAMVCIVALSLFAGVRVVELLRFTAANSFLLNEAFVVVSWIVAAAVFAFMFSQYLSYRMNPAVRRQAWKQVAGSADANAIPKDLYVNILIPRDAGQRRRFYFVALTAGVCEEFIFRGVAFAMCHSLFPDMSIYFLPLIPGAVFGIAHIYQGMTGVFKTGALGILLGYLYVATGSLLVVMAIHAMIDVSSCYLAPDREEPEADEGTPEADEDDPEVGEDAKNEDNSSHI